MALRAVLRDGREVTLAAEYGETPDDLLDVVSRGNLTGSAVPLAGIMVKTTSGEEVSYADINTFASEVDHAFGETRRR